jgi:hypothetical protein
MLNMNHEMHLIGFTKPKKGYEKVEKLLKKE